jgi:dolichol kinase
MWPEIKRKFFHLMALVYVVGVIYLPRSRFLLLLLAWLVVEVLFEKARHRNVFLNDWIFERFGPLFRPEERGHFSGVFWMILGVLTTGLLLRPVPVVVTVLLYLILGDGVASLVGMRWGGPRWPRSKKTLSGSVACFLVCLLVGATILRPAYDWSGVLAGAVAATLLELVPIRLNDNFLIPAGSSLVMMIFYGLRPVFL